MKIVSVNIEDKKHISRVIALVEREMPDVLFVQEICEKNLSDISSLIGGSYSFAPMAFKDTLNDRLGIAVFSSLPVVYTIHTLKEADRTVASYSCASFEDRFRSQSYHALEAVVTDLEGKFYRFYNTHLPVTEAGSTTEFQFSVVKSLLKVLAQNPDAILVGDANAPRGKEAFSMIAASYKDNIPTTYTTSIDNTLHRAAPLELMIAMLFTTPEYVARNARLITGVSDHCAVCAVVERV